MISEKQKGHGSKSHTLFYSVVERLLTEQTPVDDGSTVRV